MRSGSAPQDLCNLKLWATLQLLIVDVSLTTRRLTTISTFIIIKKTSKYSIWFQAEHFPFLGITGVGDMSSTRTEEMRCRTMLYTALGRLLMVELGEDEERFHAFMMPLTGEFGDYFKFFEDRQRDGFYKNR